ncbi:MAG: glycosyltransferase family 1 protein [Desulfobacteraceae bacterium]|jgi:glycosyltransferase involved in cell wall biosynthesis|nr:MAG: glycosyltransferase family 1 protein [Desulfobacteraceae bacterium]
MKHSVYIFSYLFPPDYTGASIQAINLAKALRECGEKITFVTASQACYKHHSKQYEGFPVIRLKCKRENALSIIVFWSKIFWLCFAHRKKFDLIHVIGLNTLLNVIPIIGKLLNKPTLVKTTLSNEAKQFKFMESTGREHAFNYFSVKKYDKIICISSMLENEIKNLINAKGKVVYIPNGVDTKKFYPIEHNKKSKLRELFRLPINTVIFSYIGVLHKRKNLEWLIKNWLQVCLQHKNAKLLIAGPHARNTLMADGGGAEYAEYLQFYSCELGGDQKIFFLPFRKDVENYFRASDFFINPSFSEGLSNSMLESMACGNVPIVNKTSGVDDVIDEGIDGFIFDVNDEKSFQEIIVKCCSLSNEHYKQYSAAAVKKIRLKFSLDAITKQYIKLYNNICHGPNN